MVAEPAHAGRRRRARRRPGAAARPAGGARGLRLRRRRRCVGVVTRKTLVREVVATGRDPRDDGAAATIAEPPLFTLELRARPRRGVPRARGARPRARAGRRGRPARRRALARACCSAAWPRTSRRPRTETASSRCRRRAEPRPLPARAARPPRARRRRGCRARSPRSRRGRRSRAPRAAITAPATITGARSGLERPQRPALGERQRREPVELLVERVAREPWPWTRSGS